MAIVIRHAMMEDVEALKALHAAQGFAYELPEFERSDWVLRGVLEEERGKPQMAILLRKTLEEYLLIGPEAGKGEARIGKIIILQKEAEAVAKAHGFTDIHCWPPPSIEEHFGRHLQRFEWLKPEWVCYMKHL
jgi:hypothetical protein